MRRRFRYYVPTTLIRSTFADLSSRPALRKMPRADAEGDAPRCRAFY